MVNTGRRQRNRAARHSQLVSAAGSIVAEKGLDGLTMGEVAERVDCAVGTIKSRVNRARKRLASLMSLDSVDDFGPDRETQAAMSGSHRR